MTFNRAASAAIVSRRRVQRWFRDAHETIRADSLPFVDPGLLGITCRTPAEHREAVAKAGDSQELRLGWPTAERLSAVDMQGLAALVRWRDAMEPMRQTTVLDRTDESMASRTYRKERPSLRELLEAARDGSGAWAAPVRIEPRYSVDGALVRLGELVFFKGRLIQWGANKRGQPLVPREEISRPRRDAGPSARQRLAIDPDGDAASNEGELLDQQSMAESEAWRLIEARAMREAVGSSHAKILDLAISSATAREIGEEAGYRGKYAERKGVTLINDAISELQRHFGCSPPANDNEPEEELKIAA